MSLEPIPAVRVLERIPKEARHQCCLKLTTILEGVVRKSSADAWDCLLQFFMHCLHVPLCSRGRGGASIPLASRVKEQVHLEEGPSLRDQGRYTEKHPQKIVDPRHGLAHRVTSQIEAGDFRGAIWLASSEICWQILMMLLILP